MAPKVGFGHSRGARQASIRPHVRLIIPPASTRRAFHGLPRVELCRLWITSFQRVGEVRDVSILLVPGVVAVGYVGWDSTLATEHGLSAAGLGSNAGVAGNLIGR